MAGEDSGALRTLLALFKIGVDSKELEEGQKSLGEFLGKVKQVGREVAEAFAVTEIYEFVKGQVEAAGALKATAIRLGTGIDDLQAYELAAREADVSVESMTTGLRFLNRNIGEANLGTGRSAATFQRLGIHLKDAHGQARPVGEVMGDIADKVAAAGTSAEKTQIAMALLGRGGAALIPILNRGSEAFAEARKEVVELGGGITEDFIKQAEEAAHQSAKLDFAWMSMKVTLAQSLLPVFTWMVEHVQKIVVAFRGFLAEHPAIERAITFLGGVLVARAAIGLAALAAPLLVLAAEALIAAAPVIALGLAFEDLYTLMTGGESVIGDTIDELFGIGTAKDFAEGLNESLSAMIDIIKNVGAVVYDSFVGAFEAAFEVVKGLGTALGDIASGNATKALQDLTNGENAGAAAWKKHADNQGQNVSNLGDDFTLSAEGRRQKKIDREIKLPNGQFGPPSPSAALPHAPQSIYGSRLGPMYVPKSGVGLGGGFGKEGGVVIHQSNDTKIEIHGAHDAKATGEAVKSAVATGTQRGNSKAITAGTKT